MNWTPEQLRGRVRSSLVGACCRVATRAILVLGTLLTCSALSWAMLVSPAQAVGTGTNVSLQLSPATIIANGSSTSTATATVTDGTGAGVPGETVTFTPSALGESIGTVTDHGDGTYTATITSSTTVGSGTVTATDTSATASPQPSGQATLTQTAGPAQNVALSLSPTAIVANGSSTSTATATVTDAQGHPLSGETVTFTSSDPGQQISATTDNHDGTYTATITSSTTVGTSTITATDTSASGSPSGQATLTQTAGPAAHVAVTMSPSSVPADGTSTSTATATVTDAQGHPLSGETVSFASSDPGERVSATTNNHNGSYAATITSSTQVGFVAITATDSSVTPNVSGQALFGQAANSSATTLTVAANAPVTNQSVTLIATVTSSFSGAQPTGTVTFEDHGQAIAGCGSIPVAPSGQSATVTCPATFSAQTSPAQLTAVFTSTAGSAVADSTSATHTLLVGQDPTSIILRVPSAPLKVGAPVTYRATVAGSIAGPYRPSGSVQFRDHGKVIAACANAPLTPGPGGLVARCRVQYGRIGTHAIAATYGGDGGFARSASVSHALVIQPIRPLGRVAATTDWQFFYTLQSTRITMMRVLSARAGTTVLLICRGPGCPSPLRAITVGALRVCHPGRCRTQTTHPLDLTPTLRSYRLRPGSVLTIELTRPYWTGKAYIFTIQSGQGPSHVIRCVAPDSIRPVPCGGH